LRRGLKALPWAERQAVLPIVPDRYFLAGAFVGTDAATGKEIAWFAEDVAVVGEMFVVDEDEIDD
jgi:hypothetical protein